MDPRSNISQLRRNEDEVSKDPTRGVISITPLEEPNKLRKDSEALSEEIISQMNILKNSNENGLDRENTSEIKAVPKSNNEMRMSEMVEAVEETIPETCWVPPELGQNLTKNPIELEVVCNFLGLSPQLSSIWRK